MLDIQRRHASVFTIRLGHQVEASNGKMRPEKLTDRMRITAPSEATCKAFVEVYGGEVRPFDEPKSKDRFEAYLPTSWLRIMVLPGQSLQQWWEMYKRSVCVRRCDGEKEQKSGKACLCPAEIDERLKATEACRPMTRVNVLCPDVQVIGSGSLVTHSMIAAETLPQSIAIAEAALSRGFMVPGVLRVVEHKSLNHFIYPVIEIVGVSLNELAGVGDRLQLATEATPSAIEAEARPRFTPVPVAALPSPPNSSVAEQVATVGTQQRPARKNAQVEIPRTGLQPRTAAEVEGNGAAPPVPTADEPDDEARDRLRKKHHAEARGAFPGKRGVTAEANKALRDEQRHALISFCTEGRVSSSNDLTESEHEVVSAWLRDLAEGRAEAVDEDGWRFVRLSESDPFAEGPVGMPGGPGSGEVSAASPPGPEIEWDADEWKAFLSAAGVSPARALKALRALCAELDRDQPSGMADVYGDVALTGLLRGLVEEGQA